MSDPIEPAPTVDQPAAPTGPIVARRGTYFRNARLILVAVVFVFGIWSAYDGFKAWPELNKQIEENNRQLNAADKNDLAKIGELSKKQKQLGEPKNSAALLLNRILAFVLPALSIAYLVYFLHKSRGEIRLENDVLTAPGHPPVPLSAVTSIDAKLWDKKGIAKVHYTTADKSGTITLDDFVYDQKPVDAIYDRLKAATSAPVEPPVKNDSVLT